MFISSGLVFMLTITSFVFEVVSNPQETPMIPDQFAMMCPFTAQCHRSAKKFLQRNPRVFPCCTSCSCHDDCRAMGNCCPDKRESGLKPIQFSCKETLVKRRKHNYNNEKNIYRGHDSGIKRYFIVDNCLDNITSKETAKMCSKTKDDSATLEDLVWVSDLDSGRIFQNKLCAKCHGVTNIIQWQVITTCFNILQANISTAVATLLSDPCSIIVNVPEKIAAAAEDYLCFLPEYSSCNETGLWDKYDAKLEESCLDFTSVYFYPQAYLQYFVLYKNVFCYACNQRYQTIPIRDVCLFLDTGSKSETITFSALFDFRRYTQPMTSEQTCGIAEIMDKHNKECRGLLCPFTKTPFYGTCIPLVRNISGVKININFKIRILEDWNVSNLKKSEIGRAIYKAFNKNIGLKRAKCVICNFDVMRQPGSEATSPQLYLEVLVYTTPHCQFDRFIELVQGVLAKEINVTWPDKSSLPFMVSIGQSTLQSTAKSMYGKNPNLCPGAHVHYLQNGDVCPQIELKRAEMASFVERAGKTQKMLLEEGMMDDSSNGTIRICLDEYFATFDQTSGAFLLSHAGSSIIACHFVLCFIVYVYQQLLL